MTGADRAASGPGGQPGDQVVDDRGQLGAVGLERAGRLAQRQGEPADFGVAYGLLPAGACGLAASGQPGQDGVLEAGAGQAPVGVIPSRRSTRSRLVCAVLVVVGSCREHSRMRRPLRSSSAGVGSSSAWSCSPLSIVRCASIRSAWSLPQRLDHDRVTSGSFSIRSVRSDVFAFREFRHVDPMLKHQLCTDYLGKLSLINDIPDLA
jgi:hypothetical protein